MTEENIRKFFKDRPSISIKLFEEEAGLPFTTITKFLMGSRKLPKKHLDKILEVMGRYGMKIN